MAFGDSGGFANRSFPTNHCLDWKSTHSLRGRAGIFRSHFDREQIFADTLVVSASAACTFRKTRITSRLDDHEKTVNRKHFQPVMQSSLLLEAKYCKFISFFHGSGKKKPDPPRPLC
jgi:hypothetical protein